MIRVQGFHFCIWFRNFGQKVRGSMGLFRNERWGSRGRGRGEVRSGFKRGEVGVQEREVRSGFKRKRRPREMRSKA